MTAEIKGNKLIVTIDLETPRPSASGKTLIVATGNLKGGAVLNGKPVTIGLNAYIQP
jgi:hypothetical protein